jgi:uncharacterized protein
LTPLRLKTGSSANGDALRSLNVLRALIADTTNASKSASPLSTDLQVLALLRKRSALSKSASAEFAAANRNDLKEKEDAQIAVLDEYASHVKIMGKDEIQQAILESIEKLRSERKPTSLGDVMKAVSGTGGPLHGKPVEKGEIALLVKEAISNSS